MPAQPVQRLEAPARPPFAEEQAAGAAAAVLAQPVHPKIRALVEYWLAIRPPDELPGRRQFDPMAIPSLLPNLWLLDVERTPQPRYRYRLIGTKMAQAFATESTGRYLDEVHPSFPASAAASYLDQVVARGLASWRRGRPTFWGLQDFISLERVYLPMAGDGRRVDMVLALTVLFGIDGREY